MYHIRANILEILFCKAFRSMQRVLTKDEIASSYYGLNVTTPLIQGRGQRGGQGLSFLKLKASKAISGSPDDKPKLGWDFVKLSSKNRETITASLATAVNKERFMENTEDPNLDSLGRIRRLLLVSFYGHCTGCGFNASNTLVWTPNFNDVSILDVEGLNQMLQTVSAAALALEKHATLIRASRLQVIFLCGLLAGHTIRTALGLSQRFMLELRGCKYPIYVDDGTGSGIARLFRSIISGPSASRKRHDEPFDVEAFRSMKKHITDLTDGHRREHNEEFLALGGEGAWTSSISQSQKSPSPPPPLHTTSSSHFEPKGDLPKARHRIVFECVDEQAHIIGGAPDMLTIEETLDLPIEDEDASVSDPSQLDLPMKKTQYRATNIMQVRQKDLNGSKIRIGPQEGIQIRYYASESSAEVERLTWKNTAALQFKGHISEINPHDIDNRRQAVRALGTVDQWLLPLSRQRSGGIGPLKSDPSSQVKSAAALGSEAESRRVVLQAVHSVGAVVLSINCKNRNGLAVEAPQVIIALSNLVILILGSCPRAVARLD
ncbi:hypothetical protein J7T55_010904 [Diaporthe amygdali]|uniref:uncharacterized protein n=1 Tax=Phomopsis amygdali TaxID=1214568 RepID=UPI0022FDC27C|nr:uncharacterized protein J7T55_010904 [Diaporthe amygdali]KAJ0104438.1 hypothetical protein J7T55_010904 [Diaporthe amygdali]